MSPHRPTARLGVVALAAATALVGGAGVASAHVTVSSPDAVAEGYGKLVFRVPNESDTASTVSLQIQLPTSDPLASVSIEPVPGWTATATDTPLDPPVTTRDGDTLSSAVSVVSFTADPGGGIAPGQFQEFALSAGPFPDTDTMTFNVVQTYSDGTEAAWIEPTVEGQEEPESPAPVLTLGAAGDGHGGTASSTPAAAATPAADGDDTTATVALVLGGLGLVAGLAGLALGWSGRRRTVGS
ncbi:DUF1775 domain-containing protein [Modestobacter sp. I12A-02628]|uniref:YcnI family protein n=1 Tax=Goekera deserti TaxID=2497753 RepID=A0A7K3WEN6_9ACTN|nr:YcnI family protein [Goekera deserti]MPQ98407.1 DUF1775 domain-containing protein [Goekera deserti]NDI48234.1 DUF1775 domain-containing protein [Goekera deserti]NEL53983.1 YcnI family protein [Goekera deserti]